MPTRDPRAYHLLLMEAERVARKVADRIVRRYNHPSAMVDDIVQETLLAVHQNVGSFDWDRPMANFVAVIARNKAVDAIRGSRLSKFRPLEDLDGEGQLSFAPGPEARIDVARLIARLSPRNRDIVLALVIRGENVAYVAKRLGMSAVAVRVASHRAIRAMRRSVQPDPPSSIH